MKEIVIKLSDTEYNQLIYGDDGLDYEILEQAIVNGTVLPKHGDLVDRSEIEVEEDVYNQTYIIHAPTIIETDMVDPQESEEQG